jgi:PAS domain S-box-containing protein
MAQKPTYEELLERNQQIEQEAFEQKLTENMALKNEPSLSNIFRAAPIGIGVVSHNRVFKKVNVRLCEMLDYSPEELLGKSARMLYLTDEDFEYVGKEKYAQIHEQGLGTIETRLQCKDGKVIDVLLSSAFIDPNDLSVGVTFTVLDISSLRQAEKAVKESEEKYRLLVESTPDWVWICDKDGRQTFSNKAVRKILGYEIHEILGTKAFSLIHREDRKSVRKWFQKAKKQKRGWKGSVIRWQHKDGSIRFLETIAEPILDDKGNLIGYTGIDRDVTARKLSEKALQKAHDKLKEQTKRLEIKKNGLEEINTTMTVLLKKREEDKIELEDNVLTKVKELVEPYFEKIKKTKLDDHQETFLSIIESNLKEIISPFTRKMSLKYLNLTPTEIRIANLIRHGSSSKKIAELQNVSPRTIDTHRKNIRRKIGIQGQRGNLRSHLLSLH